MDNKIKIKSIFDEEFKRYGKIIEGIDFDELIIKAEKIEQVDNVEYIASIKTLEELENFQELQNSLFGDIPIQIGCCYGKNSKLNALEYHKTSEINVAATGFVLLLGSICDIEKDFTYDTKKVEAFMVPKGCAIEIYATTLHYTPCNINSLGFKSIVILPKRTNMQLDCNKKTTKEDQLLIAKNKWLIAHKEANMEKERVFTGLKGTNITIT